MKNRVLFLLFLFAWLGADAARAAGIPARSRAEIAAMLNRVAGREVAGANIKIQSIRASRGRVRIEASVGLSYYPFREESVAAMYDSVRRLLPREYRKARIEIRTDRHEIAELIPLACRRSFNRRKIRTFVNPAPVPLVRPLSSPSAPSRGLAGRHIALWQSHGRYFDQTENRWKWQRSRLWQTCEDLYTQSYVLPFLVPMLERAGACVVLPRERDVQKMELIVDNDPGVDFGTRYVEREGRERWAAGGVGFAHLRDVYRADENPFREGSVRRTRSVTEAAEESCAEWRTDIPERGEYAVYVSYVSTPESADDVCYTVRHLGGESSFAVNQTMGGGTWIYLGSFLLPEAEDYPVVALSNRSRRAGRVVTADAVKIGGGWGNISRTVCDSLRRPGTHYEEQTSGYPRFCEGARYWLQWAGFADSVYSPKHFGDDYKDDYMSRAHWVNTVMGGSARLPQRDGLRIPLDLALAFHSDAGVRTNDETIGTLGIFFTRDNRGRFEGGADRYLSRDLTDVVMTQVVGDIRRTFEPEWTRRGLWNRSYYEARVPCVPTMLLELLSHQNFADMRYGNDPRFKFVVSRAVYKGILRHLATQYGVPYTVQPLPVERFRVEFAADDPAGVVLSWEAADDPLEPTAAPDGYIVYTRIGEGGFDNGRRVEGTSCTLRQQPGQLYSYRVAAVNAGGESFPSETLAACRMPEERGRVLVVNGFDRVSAPLHLRSDSLTGFCNRLDSGVPYLRDISFIGDQRIFDPALAKEENDEWALGSCDHGYETEVIGGNTFDYPALHGRSIAAAGYSFCSASLRSVERGDVALDDYPAVDLILGKQRATQIGRGLDAPAFRCYSPELQQAIRSLLERGGGLFASGCYVASDLWTGEAAADDDRRFAREVLHYAYAGSAAERRPKVRTVFSPAGFRRNEYRYERGYAQDRYAVEETDLLRPVGEGASVAMRYVDNEAPAGVAYAGEGRSFVMGFPFEVISSPDRRHWLMRDILEFIVRE